ncbi:MAG TPA: hypothetical protein VHH34_06475 [Pseudonocardiaceae bacterium]|nr:hypothetical protein [Pseudonocardiaceae bacterium]
MTYWPNPNLDDEDWPQPSPRQLAALVPRNPAGQTHEPGCGSHGWLGECCTHEQTIRDHTARQSSRRPKEGTSTP